MTTDNLFTPADLQDVTDLQLEVEHLKTAWADYSHAIACERQAVAGIIQQLLDALTFLFQEAEEDLLIEAFCFCAPETGERWVAQTQALVKAVDTLRRHVPQYATQPPTNLEPKP